MEEKHPVLRRSMLILFAKNLFLQRTGRPVIEIECNPSTFIWRQWGSQPWKGTRERGDSLLKQTQKMCQIVLKHVLVMKAKHSTLEIKHFVRERRDRLLTITIQKFLWRVITQHIKIFYSNNLKNELRSCHNKINWVNFVWMQDFWMLWRMDSIPWLETLEIWHKFIQ